MAATSVDCMFLYEGVWVLRAVKLDDKAFGVNLRGRTSLPIQLELTKLPLKLAKINDSTRMVFPVIAKVLGGKFSDVRNFGKIIYSFFAPSIPTKAMEQSFSGASCR